MVISMSCFAPFQVVSEIKVISFVTYSGTKKELHASDLCNGGSHVLVGLHLPGHADAPNLACIKQRHIDRVDHAATKYVHVRPLKPRYDTFTTPKLWHVCSNRRHTIAGHTITHTMATVLKRVRYTLRHSGTRGLSTPRRGAGNCLSRGEKTLDARGAPSWQRETFNINEKY
jgi:hypothetical protein